MTTTANAVPIGTILSSAGTAIVVPRVQRPYSWDSPETKELWDDLMEFHKRYSGDSINSREYFMGAVVGRAGESNGAKVLEILDGQQRLATLTILLSVLRDQLASIDPDGAKTIQMSNLAKFVRLGAHPEYILTLNKVDRTYFRQEVQEFPRVLDESPRSASHILIKKARDFFARKFGEACTGGEWKASDLAYRLHSIIINNLKVVLVSSDTWDDVSDVFERLNDRGKGLSTLNLLRNHLISKAPGHQQDDIEGFWEQVYALSNSSSKVDTFLRHVWITHRGDVKKQALFKEIKAVMATPSTPDDLKDPYRFSSRLASDAELYKELVAARHNDPGCARWLRAIQTLGATSLLPAALACIDDWQAIEDQRQLLKALVGTFVRFSIISGGDSSDLESAVYKVAQIARSGGSREACLDLLRPLLRSDSQITENFAGLAIPNSKSGYQRHLLEELENDASDAVGAVDGALEKTAGGSSVLWIEHIYPQKPGGEWSRWESHDEAVNRIGNLTLVHKRLNVTASNRGFAHKCQIYASSGVALNSYLCGLTEWTLKELEARQQMLAERAPHAWPRF